MKAQYIEIKENGNKFYYSDQEMKNLHREDGPAVEYSNGNKAWFINSNLHREDGPAIEYANGDKSWYSNGKLHREDGPAVDSFNGRKVWLLNDKYVTEAEHALLTAPEVILTRDEIAARFGIKTKQLKIVD